MLHYCFFVLRYYALWMSIIVLSLNFRRRLILF